jgi:hypothetical protein
MTPSQTLILGFATGGALLAFWLAVRFPRLGPKTLGYGFLLLGLGMCIITALPVPAMALVHASYAARFLASFVLVLPALTFAFLATLWLVRLVHESISGHLR